MEKTISNQKMEKTLQDQVMNVCRIADHVLGNPSKGVKDCVVAMGLSTEYISLVPSIVPGVLALGIVVSPFVALSTTELFKLIHKIKKKINAPKEKDLMYRQIIARQQAVIERLQKSVDEQQAEIQHLYEVLEMLTNMEVEITKA